MARPKHAPESRREYHVGVRFTPSEYEKIKVESEKLGITASAYIRGKAFHGHIRIPKYAKIDSQAINLLSKLGGLVKKIHMESGGAYRQQTANLLEEMRQLVQTILHNDMQ